MRELIGPAATPRDPWWQAALDTLLPPRCVGCGRRGAEVCRSCIEGLRALGPDTCPRCGMPSVGGRVCRRCIRSETALRAILARYAFEGTIRAALLAFKYRAVVPVPLTAERQRTRGFNQAALLARPLAATQGWVLAQDVVQRVRETRQQTELPARERMRNVLGAFAVSQPEAVEGKRILLVDDVCTTGATLAACAAPLLESGAEGVWGLVVARDIGRR